MSILGKDVLRKGLSFNDKCSESLWTNKRLGRPGTDADNKKPKRMLVRDLQGNMVVCGKAGSIPIQ